MKTNDILNKKDNKLWYSHLPSIEYRLKDKTSFEIFKCDSRDICNPPYLCSW